MKLDNEYWDSTADAPSSFHTEIALYKRKQHMELLQKWTDIRGKNVLKTDCYEESKGQDHFLDWVAKRCKHAVGMDISPRITFLAQQRFKNVKFVPCEVQKLPFQDNSFDVIMSNSTLDHFPIPQVKKALKELHRVLKKEGTFILTLDNKENLLYYLFYQIRKILKTDPFYIDRCYTFKEATKLAEQAGFTVHETTSIVHVVTPFNKIAVMLPKNKLTQAFVRVMVKLFSKLERLPTHRHTGWFLALRCTK